jgi:endonuclease YncB( thermonuclease family)
MAKAIEQFGSGLTVGHVMLRSQQAKDPVVKDVHDGDTVEVLADGDFGVRLLGVDAPEVSTPLPGKKAFVPLDRPSDTRWEDALAAVRAPGAEPLGPGGDPGLVAHLQGVAVAGEAANHGRLADGARDAFAAMVAEDIAKLGVTPAAFRFFMAFAGDVMDRYGRLLGYIQPDQPNTPVAQRFGSYNERLLAEGWVSPYFIWPNTNPWRALPSIVDAVPAPGTAAATAAADSSLDRARTTVATARAAGIGIYEAANPLRLLPFELRILSRVAAPDRWLVDLSAPAGTDTLIAPQDYHTVPLPEDRLFIPAEYVPLWREKGWR